MDEKAIEQLTEIYSEMETDLLLLICSHFDKNEEFQNSDYWRFRKLDEMGLLNQQVVEYIAKYNKTTPAKIKAAMNEIGYSTYDLDKLSRVFEDGRLQVDPNKLIENRIVQELIDSSYNELTRTFTTLSKKIQQETLNAYLQVVDEAYIKTASGTISYNQAILESIDKLSNKGITVLTYTTKDEMGNITGIRNYNIEGTARREILTSTRKLSNDINVKMIEELKPEYVEISEHLQCRPQHFSWQGTIIKADKWKIVTGYGEVDGLGGINCKHYPMAYFGDNRGKDEKKYTLEECDKAYKLSQKQRYLERGVRNWERKAQMLKQSNFIEESKKARKKANEWRIRVDKFTKNNNLVREFEREYVGTNK